MTKKYVYNLKTNKLHIIGFCPATFDGMKENSDYKFFISEDAALAFGGRAVSMCKKCQKKRDTMLNRKK